LDGRKEEVEAADGRFEGAELGTEEETELGTGLGMEDEMELGTSLGVVLGTVEGPGTGAGSVEPHGVVPAGQTPWTTG